MAETIAELYAEIARDAAELMFRDGLNSDEAFRQATPKHFEKTAKLRNFVPNDFQFAVYASLRKLEERMKDEDPEKWRKGVANGQIVADLLLKGVLEQEKNDEKGDKLRFKVLTALKALARHWEMVFRPTGKTWACTPSKEKKPEKAKRAGAG